MACTTRKTEEQSPKSTEQQDTIITVEKSPYLETEDTNRTIQDKWNDFYTAKDSVDSALARGDYKAVRIFLKKAAFHAKEVSRNDIAAWQLNNIGFYSIMEFKENTDYDNRMRTIENMRRGPAKVAYIKETKELFNQYLPKMLQSVKYLEEAYDLDKDYYDEDRTNKIYSNLSYIDWVRNFTDEK